MEPSMFSTYKGHGYFKDDAVLVALEAPDFFKGAKRAISKLLNKTSMYLIKKENKQVYSNISKCKGDITKCIYYKDAKTSLDYIETMEKNGNGGCRKFVENTVVLHEFILKHQNDFKKMAKTNSHATNQFWLVLYMYFFASVSLLVVKGLDFSGGVVRWSKEDKIAKYSVYKASNEITASIRNHKLDEAIKKALKGETVANESPIFMLAGVAIGVFLLVYIVRYLVHVFLDYRVRFADWLRAQSSFVRMISANNSRITDSQKAKEESDASVLDSIAKKVDVDLDHIEESGASEFEKENKAVINEVQKNSDDNDNLDVPVNEVDYVGTAGNTAISGTASSALDF